MMTNEEKYEELAVLYPEGQWDDMVAKAKSVGKKIHTHLRIADVVLPNVPWDEVELADQFFFGMHIIKAFLDLREEWEEDAGEVRVSKEWLETEQTNAKEVLNTAVEVQTLRGRLEGIIAAVKPSTPDTSSGTSR